MLLQYLKDDSNIDWINRWLDVIEALPDTSPLPDELNMKVKKDWILYLTSEYDTYIENANLASQDDDEYRYCIYMTMAHEAQDSLQRLTKILIRREKESS